MAKKEDTVQKAKFSRAGVAGDAKAPARTPWGASLRNSLPIRLEDNQQHTIKFALSCDRAVVVWPHENLNGLNAPKTTVVPPGEEISVTVWNTTGRTVEISESTMLLHVAILPQVEFEF